MAPSKTILIVEDDAALRAMEARILSNAGYTTIQVPDGESALKLLLEQPVGLVLLDIMMPGINGLQVAEAMRAHPDTKTIPVIFVTAKGDTATMKQGFGIGARVYLTKPFSTQLLLSSVRSVVGAP